MLKLLLAILLFSSPTIAGELSVTPRMPIATATSHQWVSAITAGGATTLSQPAFTDISGVATIANGGSNNGSLGVTAGGVVYTDGTKLINTGAGSSGQFLQSNGSSAPTWAAPTVVYAPPAIQTYTSSTGTHNKAYTFVITSGSATAAATYTNNSITYTVLYTVSSATQVVMSGSGAPLASGTLTKASGTGDSTLTFSQVLSPLVYRVRIVGAGGGGAGSGTGSDAGGGTGGNTTFGTSLLTANGGVGGTKGSTTGAGGAGGTASIGAGGIGLAFSGATGTVGGNDPNGGLGGTGGVSPFGGAGGPALTQAAGTAAIANTGSGGGGGAGGAAYIGGGGGGAGGFVDALIPSPAATYSYAVGAAGTAGTAGTAGFAGSLGGSGLVEVRSDYQ